MTDSDKLRWGILGAGRMAAVFADDLAASQTGRLSAIASRTAEKAEAFGAARQIPRRHASYEALLEDPEVDIVFIALPHPLHAAWCIRAAEAGKHILCEKPFTLNHPEAMAVIEAVRRHDVFLLENFAYRTHPQTAKLRDLLWQNVIGEVRLIRASIGFKSPFDAQSRLFNPDLGGGAILDTGCYAVSLARLVAGVVGRREFADPVEVAGSACLAPTGVDENAAAILRFPDGLLAQVACSLTAYLDNELTLFGTEGVLTVPRPFHPGPEPPPMRIRRRGEKETREIAVTATRPLFALAADHAAAFLRARQSPAMKWNDSLGNMRALDLWRRAANIEYPSENPENMIRPVHGRPLAVRANAYMPRARLTGLDKEASRLVLGSMYLTQAPLAFSLYDEFMERGGNAFDTAHVYGGGKAERLFGHWQARRNVRDRIVLIVKGAHTPFCTPEWMTRQFVDSLDRLQTDYADIYLLHRDNIEVPVGEFIEVLNEHQRNGRIGLFGVSNWNVTRIEAANAYAREKGLQGFAAVSNHFSLARMVEPMWPGAISAADPKSRDWLARNRIPLLPWSSQASGFFARANPAVRDNAEFVRAWFAPDNFERLERARTLAGRRGVTPNQIALAYALNQPFPSFPIIGPLALPELRDSCESVLIRLTPQENAWLNLESAALDR